MGYHTDFSGQFAIEPPLKPEHNLYLMKFKNTRRMKRDATIAATLPDPERDAVGLPIGPDAAYFVGGGGDYGQDKDVSVIDYNVAPGAMTYAERAAAGLPYSHANPGQQPGLWCQWVPTEEGDALEWDGGEKFYNYVDWLTYLVEHFLAPWGYKISGEVSWSGEESDDHGVIYAKDNQVQAVRDTNPGPVWDDVEA